MKTLLTSPIQAETLVASSTRGNPVSVSAASDRPACCESRPWLPTLNGRVERHEQVTHECDNVAFAAAGSLPG
jgi:hypothetical protein